VIAEAQLTLKNVTDRAADALKGHEISADRVEIIGLAVKDAATASRTNDQPGLKAAWATLEAAMLDPRVVAVRDQYFKIADISPTGELKWELKDGAVAKSAVEAMDKVNRAVYNKTLLPSDYAADVAEGYDKETGPRTGQAVLGVPNSQGKNHEQMEVFLQPQGISLSSRYNSLVSLNVGLLLTGKHPLENGMELRDARGVLAAVDNRLDADDHDAYRPYDNPRLSALGSRN